MKLEIISYQDLTGSNAMAANRVKTALSQQGIMGVSQVPKFVELSEAYITAARRFSALPTEVKQQYAPNRDAGETEGYELGAEWFKDQQDQWQVDDKKASYYAYVPDQPKNKWPREVDIKTAYLALGELIYKTGLRVLKYLGITEAMGISDADIYGYGRMLHYLKESDATNANPNWCGGHYDHGIFTGLAPAYYFRDGHEVSEPAEAGLYILPTGGKDFVKINTADKSILLFQVGEFSQLVTNDRIHATKHIVKKAHGNIERFTYALFFNAVDHTVIHSDSILSKDMRYRENMDSEGNITYGQWSHASFARYRAL